MEVTGSGLAALWWGHSLSNSVVTGIVVAIIAVFAIVYVGLRVSGKSAGSLSWRYLAYFGAAVAVVVGLGFVIGLEDMLVKPAILQLSNQ